MGGGGPACGNCGDPCEGDSEIIGANLIKYWCRECSGGYVIICSKCGISTIDATLKCC